MLADKSGRAKMRHEGAATVIDIPVRKNYFLLLFLPVWIGGWFSGFTSAGRRIFSDLSSGTANGFLIFWLAGWTVGGAFAVFAFLWNAFGRETIISSHGSMSISKNIFSLGIKREYLKSEIRNFKVHEKDESFFRKSRNMEIWGFGKGIISFDYGMRTVYFGITIDEPEAQHLVEIISNS